jgi:hypothetical protein
VYIILPPSPNNTLIAFLTIGEIIPSTDGEGRLELLESRKNQIRYVQNKEQNEQKDFYFDGDAFVNIAGLQWSERPRLAVIKVKR